MNANNPAKIKMSPSGVVLNEAGVSTGIVMKEGKLLNNSNLWAKFTVQDNIKVVLNKRYTPSTRTMNLDNFDKDPDLTEVCPLSQPKNLYIVLDLCQKFKMQNLRLSNNDIHNLTPIEYIFGMKSLTTLDLRNNAIGTMAELNILKSMQISDLLLDGNPLCDGYDEYSYVQAVKEVCPKIEKLDGIILGQKGFLTFRRNYICKIEAQELVNQFLEHYFTLYDTASRSALDGLYHKQALFSLTCTYLSGQITTSTASLGQYKCMSRNLKLLSDLAKSGESLVQGSSNIIKALCNLPATEHDPYTFTVDLVYNTATTAVLTVTGVFRETTQFLNDSEQILGFARTFVLVAGANGEYTISNEQVHVSNATTTQQQRAFKMVRVPKASQSTMVPALTIKEKNEMAKTMKIITTLNENWSKKYLEECQYDLKKALGLFVDSYKLDQIPEEAFVN